MVAIVDLDTLDLPEPEITEPQIEESEALPLPEKFSLHEPEMEDLLPEPALEPEPQTIDLAQLTAGVLAPPPLFPMGIGVEPDTNDPPLDSDNTIVEEILEPGSPEPGPLEIDEAPGETLGAEPEPIEEALSMPEPAQPEEVPVEIEEVLVEVEEAPIEIEEVSVEIEEAPIEIVQQVVEELPEETEPEPEAEALPLDEVLPPAEPEPIEEALAIPESAPPEEVQEATGNPVEETLEALAVSVPVETPMQETPAEPVSALPSPAPAAASPQEPAPDTPTEKTPEPEALMFTSVTVQKNPIVDELDLPPTPPPPPPKPSKEKIKKFGLLGLLQKGENKAERNRPVLAKRFPPARKPLKRPKNKKSNFTRVGTEQRIARLKRDVLGAEQQRLMQRRSLPGRGGRSEIEITHGAGRNYNIVASAIQKKSNGLSTVYSALLQMEPNLQGNVLVEFEISSQGKVTKCTILTSSLGSSQFEKRLVQEILHWTFRPTEKGRTTVLYPLSFFPSG